MPTRSQGSSAFGLAGDGRGSWNGARFLGLDFLELGGVLCRMMMLGMPSSSTVEVIFTDTFADLRLLRLLFLRLPLGILFVCLIAMRRPTNKNSLKQFNFTVLALWVLTKIEVYINICNIAGKKTVYITTVRSTHLLRAHANTDDICIKCRNAILNSSKNL